MAFEILYTGTDDRVFAEAMLSAIVDRNVQATVSWNNPQARTPGGASGNLTSVENGFVTVTDEADGHRVSVPLAAILDVSISDETS